MNINKLVKLVLKSSGVGIHYIHGAWSADYSIRIKELSDTDEKVCSGTHDELRVDRAFIWYTVYLDRTEIKEISNKDAKFLYRVLRAKYKEEELARDNRKLKKLRDLTA